MLTELFQKKLFANYVTDNRLTSRIYKEYIKNKKQYLKKISEGLE